MDQWEEHSPPGMITIICLNHRRCLHNFIDALQDFIAKTCDGYEVQKEDYAYLVDFQISGRNVRLCVTTREEIKDVDVCVICCWFSVVYKHNGNDGKKWASHCKRLYPKASIIIFSNQTELKRTPDYAKYSEINGQTFMSQAVGNQLANEIGAVKFIECSTGGRGVKILFDEIAFAGFTKLKENNKREMRKQEKEREKSKLPIFC